MSKFYIESNFWVLRVVENSLTNMHHLNLDSHFSSFDFNKPNVLEWNCGPFSTQPHSFQFEEFFKFLFEQLSKSSTSAAIVESNSHSLQLQVYFLFKKN